MIIFQSPQISIKFLIFHVWIFLILYNMGCRQRKASKETWMVTCLFLKFRWWPVLSLYLESPICGLDVVFSSAESFPILDRLGVVGDWTFGSRPYPRKCSLTCSQGHNEMEPSVPEGTGRTLRSASSKTMTFGLKDTTFWRPKAMDGCPEALVQTPRPSVRRIPPPPCRRWRTATRKHKLEDQDLREKSPRPGTMAAGQSLMEPSWLKLPEVPEGHCNLRRLKTCE